ncbi:MAG: antibiotic biosynthesis monooxygenase [Acidobacteriia bacterium]|nr:antibiotic biosynthesis monooxygenase [Terriglobia bacterium]
MKGCPYLAIWEFEIKADCRAQFEEVYGPDGAWAQLFRQSPDYLGTKLLCDLTRPGRYLTLDSWSSREAFHTFKQAHAAEYETLDKQCEGLTEGEAMVGEFEEAPAKSGR